MTYTDMMVDIETLDTCPTAVVTQIGWCFFNIDNTEIPVTAPNRINVDIDSCLDAGLTVSGGTLRWWMEQSNAARQSAFAEGITLELALKAMEQSVTGVSSLMRVWANPPQFDLSILRHAHDRVGLKLPWSHRMERCSRTWWYEKDPMGQVSRVLPAVKHDAGYDAQAQAQTMLKIVEAQ